MVPTISTAARAPAKISQSIIVIMQLLTFRVESFDHISQPNQVVPTDCPLLYVIL